MMTFDTAKASQVSPVESPPRLWEQLKAAMSGIGGPQPTFYLPNQVNYVQPPPCIPGHSGVSPACLPTPPRTLFFRLPHPQPGGPRFRPSRSTRNPGHSKTFRDDSQEPERKPGRFTNVSKRSQENTRRDSLTLSDTSTSSDCDDDGRHGYYSSFTSQYRSEGSSDSLSSFSDSDSEADDVSQSRLSDLQERLGQESRSCRRVHEESREQVDARALVKKHDLPGLNFMDLYRTLAKSDCQKRRQGSYRDTKRSVQNNPPKSVIQHNSSDRLYVNGSMEKSTIASIDFMDFYRAVTKTGSSNYRKNPKSPLHLNSSKPTKLYQDPFTAKGGNYIGQNPPLNQRHHHVARTSSTLERKPRGHHNHQPSSLTSDPKNDASRQTTSSSTFHSKKTGSPSHHHDNGYYSQHTPSPKRTRDLISTKPREQQQKQHHQGVFRGCGGRQQQVRQRCPPESHAVPQFLGIHPLHTGRRWHNVRQETISNNHIIMLIHNLNVSSMAFNNV